MSDSFTRWGIRRKLKGLVGVFPKERTERAHQEWESRSGPEAPLSPSAPAHIRLVRERVEQHRDASLEYHLWLISAKQGIREEELDRLFRAGPRRLAAPVLDLRRDDVRWDEDELSDLVQRTLRLMGLPDPVPEASPARRADEACRVWAMEEARVRWDRFRADSAGEPRTDPVSLDGE